MHKIVEWSRGREPVRIYSLRTACSVGYCLSTGEYHYGQYTLCDFHRRRYRDWMAEQSPTIKERTENAMASIRGKIKEALLSKDERLVRKYNIVNSDGSPNAEGRKILADILFEENFDKVVERLRLIEKDEKKK